LPESDVVACGLASADERPSRVDVPDDRPTWSGLVGVGADGWGEDMLALGDADPDPGGGEQAFAVAPIDVGADRARVGLRGQAGDQGFPFVARERPGLECVASFAVVDPGDRGVEVMGDAVDGRVEGVGGLTLELLFDDGGRVFAGVVRDSEKFCGLGGMAADTDLRKAGRCGTAQQLRFDVGDVSEVFGVPFRQQMLWDVLDTEPVADAGTVVGSGRRAPSSRSGL
jgi:hypothetical protein